MFLKSRKPTVITTSTDNVVVESEGDAAGNSPYDTFLLSRKPIVLVHSPPKVRDPSNRMFLDDSDMVYDPHTTIIAPMNTDIRTSIMEPYESKMSAYERELLGVEKGYVDDSDIVPDVAFDDLVIPPLNTDLRFSAALPEFTQAEARLYASVPMAISKLVDLENFSWHIITKDDTPDVVAKKKLMHPVQNQHMCGSCWAMALAGCISDCFVVSGAVDWMPRISPTYLMTTIPQRYGNSRCDGGHPAAVARALESIPVTDTTCIDYSWCTSDSDLCTSSEAANHFGSVLGEKLNRNIPVPAQACYFEGERYMYQIDSNSDAYFITDDNVEEFRNIVKTHMIEFGPPLAGYAVLNNFVTGNFTDPTVNQGVYFDRANYPSSIRAGTRLTFSDSNLAPVNVSGLHAVEIVGWGVAKNVQYDNDKFGDVPFWWAKNSWGSNWGSMGGRFKMAMYPYNKFGQFGKQINFRGSTVGGLIMVRCTKPPFKETKKPMAKYSLNAIRRTLDDDYYKMTPEELKEISKIRGGRGPTEEEEKPQSDQPQSADGATGDNSNMTYYLIIGVAVLIIIGLIILMRRR